MYIICHCNATYIWAQNRKKKNLAGVIAMFCVHVISMIFRHGKLASFHVQCTSIILVTKKFFLSCFTSLSSVPSSDGRDQRQHSVARSSVHSSDGRAKRQHFCSPFVGITGGVCMLHMVEPGKERCRGQVSLPNPRLTT